MFGYSLAILLAAMFALTDSTGQLTKEEARRSLELAGWDQALHREALSVMACESSWITDRTGDGGDSVGLFQIQWTPKTWVGWRSAPGMERLKNKNPYNPITNSKIALVIYKNYGGWSAWTCKPSPAILN